MINGYPLAVAGVCFALIWALWRRDHRHATFIPEPKQGWLARWRHRGDQHAGQFPRKGLKPPGPLMPRFHGALVTLATLCLTIGFVPWLDTLASWTATKSGLAVLAVVMLVLAPVWWWEVVCRQGFHHGWTTASSALLGPAVVATAGNFWRMLHQGAKALPATAQAFSTAVTRIHSGKAAHEAASMPISGSHVGAALGFVALALVLFVVTGGFRALRRTMRLGKQFNRAATRGLPAGQQGGRQMAIGGRN